MSTSTTLEALQFAAQQTTLYGGIFILLIGIFGEVLNITVFSTLKIFRRTTCSLYLIVNATASIGMLIGTSLRILFGGLIGDTVYTPALCKIRNFIIQFSILMSLASMSFATIDQFISMTKYKQWNSLRLARRLIFFTFIIIFLYCIPVFIYFDADNNICVINNSVYNQFYTYIHVPTIGNFVPLLIMVIFSLLAFHKTRSRASRQINIVRLSHNRQLAAMTLFHAWCNILLIGPLVVFYVYMVSVDTKDPMQMAINALIYIILVFFYHIGYTCSFYIYCCVSKRFRKQVIYVLFKVHLQRWRRRLHRNDVIPAKFEMAQVPPRTGLVSHNDIALY